ncbi:cytochrome P450 [Dothidotthia symphoricarpi CBS 119687]|uniref:Cytochrome P450 n=1 Tax=Dothidotthia symphoricarpi CBS 119687 TaxID=1392245 RepID=A0A6A6AE92_9PLEO|nr:cytochrome P450 [Dothidotthia symphoricarpi CBS 119687]KAF2130179.1 cytochrome P450 [Dothidotthia symphoricarpi CBS 119687]
MAPTIVSDAIAGFNPLHFSVLVTGIIVARFLYVSLTCPTRHLPGPWYTRFTHLRLKRAVVTGQRIFYIDNLHKQYGPIVRLSPNEVAVADLDAFKEIHKIGTKYLKSEWYLRLANFPKAGVFTMLDPREHGPRRKLLSRSFSRTYLVEHWESVVREKALLAVQKIKVDAQNSSADIYNWWMLLASDISAHCAFGESLGMLEAGHQNQFLRVLKKLTMGAGIMVEMPFLRLLRFVPITAVQEMFNANDYIIKGAGRAVELARSRTGEQNIFAKVIEENKKEGVGHIDDMDVRIEAMNIIIAGTDTSGVTLTYLTWAVLQRPDLQAALEAEVCGLADGFTENQLINLPLLNAVIEETLRLYGAAPSSLPRIVPQGGTKFAGHYIPQGVTVDTQAYTFHRDPEIWSEPLRFNPQRWLPSKEGLSAEAHSPAARTAFHPFGAGARSCIGIHLARMELRYAVAFFFRECKGIKLAQQTTPESMDFVNFFLIAPKAHRCEITYNR